MRPALLEFFARFTAGTALTIALSAAAAHSATITIVNLDGPNEGFNDPTPAEPVGGNPETTRGAQALYVFQFAANIWGSSLPSTVEILVEANFDPLDCDGASAVLGSAGPNTTHANFDGADRQNTWYHAALANRLAGVDLDPANADIGITFNSELGKPECFPLPWYFGVDGNEGTAVELLPVVLHELGHGLGFSTTTLAGVQEVFPSIYDYQLLDKTQGMHWTEMTEPQRVASAQNCSNLVWDGPSVKLQSPPYLGPKPLLRVNSPEAIAGDYNVGLPAFGPALTETGVTGDLVLVNDGSGFPGNGCEPFVNAAAVNGKIAFMDRGGCPFVQKLKNAMDAGAIAAVIADSMPGCPALGMGGADPTITIPSVRLTNDDGARIKAALLLGVNATLKIDPAQKAGGDSEGNVLVFTPAPYQLGSSVSHWDMSATPNLLMEPALNSDLSSGTDLTRALYADIGWYRDFLAVDDGARREKRLEPSFPNPTSGTTTISFALPRAESVELAVYDLSGRLVARLAKGSLPQGRHSVKWDGIDLNGKPVRAGMYHYRLKTDTTNEGRPLLILR